MKKKASDAAADFETQKEFVRIIQGLRSLPMDVLPESFERELIEKLRTVSPRRQRFDSIVEVIIARLRRLQYFFTTRGTEHRGVHGFGSSLKWTVAFAAVIVALIVYRQLQSFLYDKDPLSRGPESIVAADTMGVNTSPEWNAICATLSNSDVLGLNRDRVRNKDVDRFLHSRTARTSSINILPDSIGSKLNKANMFSKNP